MKNRTPVFVFVILVLAAGVILSTAYAWRLHKRLAKWERMPYVRVDSWSMAPLPNDSRSRSVNLQMTIRGNDPNYAQVIQGAIERVRAELQSGPTTPW